MYIEYNTWETFEYVLNALYLDHKNPRLGGKGHSMNQPQILKYLIKNEAVYALAKKICEEGYFVGEEPIICEENNKKVVLEGNRRTAALKLIQNPKKYLNIKKANTLLELVKKNKINQNRKCKCYIADNRLVANPIIYERHHGSTLKKWKTGNQYSFVAEMYYEDGLSVDDICDLLNISKPKVLKPLKAYNLFEEGRELLERDGISIDIENFEFTNLERFYLYEDARKLIGVEFDDKNAELKIKLPKEEFENRLSSVFKILIDSNRFSRVFDKEEDKKKFVEELKNHSNFDMSVQLTAESNTESRTTKKKADLEVEKNKKTRKRRRRKKQPYSVIPRDANISFFNDKLDDLFSELKALHFTKKYSFAILLRSYLEQSLFYYLSEKKLLEDLGAKVAKDSTKNNFKKIRTLIKYLMGNHSIAEDIDEVKVAEILKFKINSAGYTNTTLKIMLDYVVSNRMINTLGTNEYKNLKSYVERIKMDLDLAIHNLSTIIDTTHNKRAWEHLSPVITFLTEDINTEE